MNIYELIGIIIGDGCLLDYPQYGIYGLEINGNVEEEFEYYRKISTFIESLLNKKPRIFIRCRPLGKHLKLVVYSKPFLEKLKKEYSLAFDNKTFDVKIPSNLTNWPICKHIIRGIFETDGCLYFSKIKNRRYPSYPRLEIKTSSKKLAFQLEHILRKRGFEPHIRKDQKVFIIYLSGRERLAKWVREIGFSSLKNKTKHQLWKEIGYYIPKLPLSERVKLLKSYGINPIINGRRCPSG